MSQVVGNSDVCMDMNPTTSPRIALANIALAVLPQFSQGKLMDLTTEQRAMALKESVDCARELMRLCNYDDDAVTATELRTAVARATQADANAGHPEWIRLPQPKGKCAYTGLSRSALTTLVTPCAANDFKPPVHSVSLRRRGTARGVRLISLQSLLDHIRSQPV